jgi:hypothetical protein
LIPEELRKKYGYPELTQDGKRKIQRFKPVPKGYEQRIPDG